MEEMDERHEHGLHYSTIAVIGQKEISWRLLDGIAGMSDL